MADGEDELEAVEVDQKLSEGHKFSLYKDLEAYRSLWDTSFVPSKSKQLNKQQKEKDLEELSKKYNLSPGYLKRCSFILRELLWHGKLRRKVTARSRSGSSSKR